MCTKSKFYQKRLGRKINYNALNKALPERQLQRSFREKSVQIDNIMEKVFKIWTPNRQFTQQFKGKQCPLRPFQQKMSRQTSLTKKCPNRQFYGKSVKIDNFQKKGSRQTIFRNKCPNRQFNKKRSKFCKNSVKINSFDFKTSSKTILIKYQKKVYFEVRLLVISG